MDWHDEITAKLPPHHEEEPPTLREEIVCELRDHLEASFRRELLICDDANIARQRVLDHFGNPADIALNLWCEAMKGKLMTNKISLALTAIVVILCFCMIGVMWNVMSTQAEMNRTQVEAMMAQTQMMMEQFKSNQTENASSTIVSDWAELTVSTLPDSTQDAVAETSIDLGINVNCNSIISTGSFGGTITDYVRLKPGENHSFGLLPAGQYQFNLTGPWGYSANKQFLLGPGRKTDYEFEMPLEFPEQYPLKIQFGSGDDEKLRDDDELLLLLLINVNEIATRTNHWHHEPIIVLLTVDPKGNVLTRKEKISWSEADPVTDIKDQKFYCISGNYSLAAVSLHRTSQENPEEKYYTQKISYSAPDSLAQEIQHSHYLNLFLNPKNITDNAEWNSIWGVNKYYGELADGEILKIDVAPILQKVKKFREVASPIEKSQFSQNPFPDNLKELAAGGTGGGGGFF